MTTEARKKANAKYEAANTKRMCFKFNLKTDADILRKFSEVDNKLGYIKKLIREDIERSQ